LTGLSSRGRGYRNVAPGVLDYIFGSIILVATVRCVLKGFVAEVVSMAAIGGGILCGFLFSAQGAEIAAGVLGDSPWNRVIAFLVLFLAVYLALKISEGLLYRFLEALHLENLDKALGFFWGLAEGVAVSVLLLLVLGSQPFFHIEPLVEESMFARIVIALIPVSAGGGAPVPE
jgi:membrane protein required for colicin V production